MQEAAIHFKSVTMLCSSYSDAISACTCSQRIILGLQKWPTNIRISSASIFKKILSHCAMPIPMFAERGQSALTCGIVLKWVRDSVYVTGNDIHSELVVVLIAMSQ
ncbi:hypothetical protein CEXT_570411 [Caerostris extrusa]|uniref:Uncharacterized protein n=1 Tax=Caerostris extrusa TaxID=172846 RepID=A0AAV4PRR9_CAEEX|nr:hypothetical protein CEXT_570411 [Caerostris extrusa]